jgi:hypothetical protein
MLEDADPDFQNFQDRFVSIYNKIVMSMIVVISNIHDILQTYPSYHQISVYHCTFATVMIVMSRVQDGAPVP